MGQRLKFDWQLMIQEQKQRGISIKDFCNEKGFSQNAFYLNRQKLGKTEFVQIKPEEQKRVSTGIKINHEGLEITLEKDFCKKTLYQLFEVLGISQ